MTRNKKIKYIILYIIFAYPLIAFALELLSTITLFTIKEKPFSYISVILSLPFLPIAYPLKDTFFIGEWILLGVGTISLILVIILSFSVRSKSKKMGNLMLIVTAILLISLPISWSINSSLIDASIREDESNFKIQQEEKKEERRAKNSNVQMKITNVDQVIQYPDDYAYRFNLNVTGITFPKLKYKIYASLLDDNLKSLGQSITISLDKKGDTWNAAGELYDQVEVISLAEGSLEAQVILGSYKKMEREPKYIYFDITTNDLVTDSTDIDSIKYWDLSVHKQTFTLTGDPINLPEFEK